jgi:hypothetical protein
VDDPNHPGFTVIASGGGGSAAVGGTAEMANKTALLAPWIAVSILIFISAGLVILRRSRK